MTVRPYTCRDASDQVRAIVFASNAQEASRALVRVEVVFSWLAFRTGAYFLSVGPHEVTEALVRAGLGEPGKVYVMTPGRSMHSVVVTRRDRLTPSAPGGWREVVVGNLRYAEGSSRFVSVDASSTETADSAAVSELLRRVDELFILVAEIEELPCPHGGDEWMWRAGVNAAAQRVADLGAVWHWQACGYVEERDRRGEHC